MAHEGEMFCYETVAYALLDLVDVNVLLFFRNDNISNMENKLILFKEHQKLPDLYCIYLVSSLKIVTEFHRVS